ncbi:AAA family ATPase [Arcobacter sp. FWKO B]|uniref:AAA family ATPase n=1 Tax=Arcobacter sp. FWKO B TaxID=2593672 RepID=UPI0018A406A0|nr:AAA family ATPase [Arcobacter sp. FWKO B]QOG12931.1 AAA family ATPase [Arcobacter sp. FWKO B]
MISDELREVFSRAISFARESRHEYLTTEHVFLMLLDNPEIIGLLDDLGVSVSSVRSEILNHINLNTPILPDGIEDEPIESIKLASTIEKMITHLSNTKGGNAKVEDMFVAIINDDKSYASYLLKLQGIQRVDILEEISHNEIYEDENKEQNQTSSLESNSIELVQKAKEGKIDPLIGRDIELDRLVEILLRRKKNNPILVGEAGVGKTAVVEGLALKIANDEVPHSLKGSKIYSLDMGSMIAGTKYRGDFEKKLKSFLSEISKVQNAIVFIDEIHTIIGAGSTSGNAMDAANILKPMLSSGELKCIGATTYAEYKNNFSKDKALGRRFSKIDIKEPSIEDTIAIIEGLKGKYEEFHGVKYNPKTIELCVNLSKKYINDRFLPDSAIDVIDEVGSIAKIAGKKTISVKDIEATFSKIANIPTKTATTSDISILKTLETNLKKRVFGQDNAIEKVVKTIKINKAGLTTTDKPIGNFLFTGPTGVGKTEIARELANLLNINLIRFDMSEYMEAHTVSKLIGAPAGYVGFEKGGLLVESIRKHPHCVLLLDEIEKAHPDIMNVLLQVLDNAKLTDNDGNIADFQNVIIIMTSNLGSSEAPIMGFAKNDNLNQSKAINKFFAPEFRNRLDAVIEFSHLDKNSIILVVKKFIDNLAKILADKSIKLKLSQNAINELAHLGYDKAMGARPLGRVIDNKIKEPLTDEILFGKLKNGGKVSVDFKDGEFKFNIS